MGQVNAEKEIAAGAKPPLLSLSCSVVTRSSLFVLLVEHDVQDYSQYHCSECTELNPIDVVPSEEVTKYQYDGSNDDEDET